MDTKVYEGAVRYVGHYEYQEYFVGDKDMADVLMDLDGKHVRITIEVIPVSSEASSH